MRQIDPKKINAENRNVYFNPVMLIHVLTSIRRVCKVLLEPLICSRCSCTFQLSHISAPTRPSAPQRMSDRSSGDVGRLQPHTGVYAREDARTHTHTIPLVNKAKGAMQTRFYPQEI